MPLVKFLFWAGLTVVFGYWLYDIYVVRPAEMEKDFQETDQDIARLERSYQNLERYGCDVEPAPGSAGVMCP